MELQERFLKYVSYDTQSSEESASYPSTDKQKALLSELRDEMQALGMTEVTMDRYGYVMGTVPATPGCENAPVVGFIAHVDTSPDMSGKDVKPRIVEDYDGGDIVLNGHLTMRVADFPELAFFKGHTLIHTDGTTLLGADDKAGVAEIMTAAEYLLAHPEVKHGKIRIGFTPDEEVGRGVDFFDVAAFGADFAYTVDGGMEGELEYENFNAASARIDIQGRNVHPGYAKGKMINAIEVACDLQRMLPEAEKPEHTEGYEGFYHCVGLNGTVEKATISYIIRPRRRPLRAKEGLHVGGGRLAEGEIRRRSADPHPQGPVFQHAQDGRTPSAGHQQGARSHADGRRETLGAAHSRRHGRRTPFVHGTALPQPFHGRHELPRQIRVLLAHHHAQGPTGNPQPRAAVERIILELKIKNEKLKMICRTSGLVPKPARISSRLTLALDLRKRMRR